MRTNDVAEITGIAASTLRQWTRGEWSPYLTKGAQGSGKRRTYTPLDVDILNHINQLKSELGNDEHVHAALKQLQNDEWENLPSVATPAAGQAVVDVVPQESANARLDEIRRAHTREIVILQDRIDTLEERLERQDSEHRAQLESERQAHQTERATIERELRDAKQALGTAEGKLTELERQDKRTSQLWVALVAVAILAAIVLTGVIVYIVNAP